MKKISPAEYPANFHLPPQLPRPPQRNKKTRELPNVSNCNCCNHRAINFTNPNDRLKTLTSEWRIVLLCNLCYCLVESSQICSYCLTNSPSVSADSTLDCKRCRRRVHRNCVSMFVSGSGNGGDFFVCFDCWVPKLFENDYSSVCEIRPRKKAKKEVRVCGDLMSLESSRVCDSKVKGMSSKEIVNAVNAVSQKKIVVALEAEEKAVEKAMRVMRLVELTGDALDFAVNRGGSGSRAGLVVDDDAQLAIQLHRAINSSPRISTNSCLLTMDSVNLSAVNVNVNSKALQSQPAQKICLSKVINVESEANTPDIYTSSYNEQKGLCFTAAKEGCVQKTDVWEDKKCKLASNSNICLITYSRKRRASPDGRSKKENNGLFRMYRRRLSHVQRRKVERDLCFKTYRRRLPTMLHCKNKLVHGGFNVQHELIAPTTTLALNCSEEARVCADAS